VIIAGTMTSSKNIANRTPDPYKFKLYNYFEMITRSEVVLS